MRRFKDIPLSRKLLLISGIVTFLVLSFASTLLIISIWANERNAAAVELETIARLIGANSTAALVFNDTTTADEILGTLETNPAVIIGILYDADGKEFVRYQRQGTRAARATLHTDEYGTEIQDRRVITSQPVHLADDLIGSILVQSTLEGRLEGIQKTVLPIIMILAFTFIIAMLIALKLSRSLTAPIKALSEIMNQATLEDNYSLRAQLNQKDEIGMLADGINNMFARIEQRDAELRAHRQELEQQVAQRTADLREANEKLTGELQERARTEQKLKRAHNNLELHHKNFRLLSEMSDRLQLCHEMEEIKPVVSHYLRQLFSTDSGALFVYNHSRSLVESVVTWGDESCGEPVFKHDDCWALRQGRLHIVADAKSGLVCPHVVSANPESYICAPMIAYGEVIGLLYSAGIQIADDSTETENTTTSAAEHLALAIANLRLREALQAQSVRDHLTSLFNRRYLQETLERELARALRMEQPTAVIMMDIDHFKSFNDTHGHEAGDIVLRDFGAFLKKAVRAEDIACRYGGEEFIVIMPGANVDIALDRAEEIRKGVKLLHLLYKGKPLPEINISLGVALAPEHANSVDLLIDAADTALYKAKHQGRDRVMLAESSKSGKRQTEN